MAHKECFEFVAHCQKLFPQHFNGKTVLEVGSLYINGSVRGFFTDCEYIGVDIGEGPGVDMVVPPDNLFFESRSFDTIISTEMFEHNPHWQKTFADMCRILKPGGMMLFTCATTGRPEHGTIDHLPAASPLTVAKKEYANYYKNLEADEFLFACNVHGIFSPYTFLTNQSSADLYFLGFKNPYHPLPDHFYQNKREKA